MLETQCVVVGAGVSGLAVARELSARGREVVVLERAGAVGTETSSRSNEVIHAGLYYRPGSPQAVLCARGSLALYEYCARHGIEHLRVGKLVVATDPESVGWIEDTQTKGLANGVRGLELLTGEAAARLEPNLRCSAALHSPHTGIVDTHGLMLAYRGDAEAHGVTFALRTELVGAAPRGAGFEVQTRSRDGEHTRLRCALLINAAGLRAADVARAVEGMPLSAVPKVHFAKGAFFSLRGRAPFRHLIVPEPKTWRLGGIFTLDLAGRGRFGPDEQWVEAIDYGLADWSSAQAYAAVRRYFPSLPDGALTPDYAGIQPRLRGPGEPPTDWIFQDERAHGLHGLINLFGLESPGITASLAIAQTVADLSEGRDLPSTLDAAPQRA
ncbi:MAG: NAD(P)/FAD-dependent oxidoreductase [Candidatus Binataceae bacterium]|nr:NAD(P)/FAD-dependent oxidoreductase [Candidatus Binataceae bacterium]